VTLDELSRTLMELGIRPRSYSLQGGTPDDRYCLERSSGGWAVYYSERGLRNDEQWFATEDEACQDLLRRVLADPTTRTGSSQEGGDRIR
jgi:hypothetical protein